MTRHIVSVISDGPYQVKVYCSCGETLFQGGSGIDLSQMNDLAHEHIEASDRTPFIR